MGSEGGVVEPGVLLWKKCSAGAVHHFQGGEVELLLRLDPAALEFFEVAGGDAQMGDLMMGGNLQENGGGGMERRAVVGDDVGAGKEGRDGFIIHGPGGCGEDHLCGRGADVVVEGKFFLLRNENATCAMDDAFWLTGCAGGVGD